MYENPGGHGPPSDARDRYMASTRYVSFLILEMALASYFFR